ncbi:MAG: membrane protein insertion efficiency factor YidD [Thermoleophilaceae bacterium]
MTPARRLLVAPIRLYQRFVSPAVGPRCKYHPSCSEYAVGAIRSFGVLRGSILAVWRLLRCNPWSLGGVDHPRTQTLFPSPPTAHRQP